MSGARVRASALLLAAAVTAGACTVQYDVRGDAWARQGAGLQVVALDEVECLRTVSDAGETHDMVLGGVLDLGRYVVGERTRAATYQRCMTDRGYRPAVARQP